MFFWIHIINITAKGALIQQSYYPEWKFFPDREFHWIGKDVGIGNISYLLERLIFTAYLDSRFAIYQEITLSFRNNQKIIQKVYRSKRFLVYFGYSNKRKSVINPERLSRKTPTLLPYSYYVFTMIMRQQKRKSKYFSLFLS